MWYCLLSCTATLLGWAVLVVSAAVSFVLFVQRLQAPKGRVDAKDKAVFVTGCDSGFGLAIAKSLDEIGFLVFAACLNCKSSGAVELQDKYPRVQMVQLDVTSDEQTEAALAMVKRVLNGNRGVALWAVVNNAGVHLISDIELVPVEKTRSILEVNTLGVVRITKAFLPLLRKTPGARVVNNTSVNGRVAFPFTSAYNMSKFATEAFTDNLRFEMKRFGVYCSLIEIGNYGGATAIINAEKMKPYFAAIRRDLSAEVLEAYGSSYVEAFPAMYDSFKSDCALSIAPVVDGFLDAVLSRSPKHRYLISGGSDALDRFTVAVWLKDLLPSSWMDFFLKRYFASTHPKPATALYN